MKTIKAVLFDSGRVLNGPRSGHWFIPPKFYRYVDKDKFAGLQRDQINRAFHKAWEYMNEHPLILTEEEEFRHFIQFYAIVSGELPSLVLNREEIEGLAQDNVYNDEKFMFYPDVFEVIPQLFEGYRLGIVSDTWPSLDRVFRHVGLRRYFSTFVMSSVLGVTKPHEAMFRTALTELNVKPEEALFVDDSLKNLEGARALGLQTVWMVRDQEHVIDSGHMCVHNLKDLQGMLL